MQKELSSGSLITFDVQMVRLRFASLTMTIGSRPDFSTPLRFVHHDNRTLARFSYHHFVSPIRLHSG